MKEAYSIGHEELVKNVMLLQASVKRLEIKNSLLSEECAIQSKMLQQLTTLEGSKARLNFRDSLHDSIFKRSQSRFKFIKPSTLYQFQKDRAAVVNDNDKKGQESRQISKMKETGFIKMISRKLDLLQDLKYGVPYRDYMQKIILFITNF